MTCEDELCCVNCKSEMVVGMAIVFMPVNNTVIPIEIDTTMEVYKCLDCGYFGNKILCRGCVGELDEWA